MLTMDSFEDVEITQLEEKGIFNPGQGVWLGLIRDAVSILYCLNRSLAMAIAAILGKTFKKSKVYW